MSSFWKDLQRWSNENLEAHFLGTVLNHCSVTEIVFAPLVPPQEHLITCARQNRWCWSSDLDYAGVPYAPQRSQVYFCRLCRAKRAMTNTTASSSATWLSYTAVLLSGTWTRVWIGECTAFYCCSLTNPSVRKQIFHVSSWHVSYAFCPNMPCKRKVTVWQDNWNVLV